MPRTARRRCGTSIRVFGPARSPIHTMASMKPELLDEPQALARAVAIDAGVDVHGFRPAPRKSTGAASGSVPLPPEPHGARIARRWWPCPARPSTSAAACRGRARRRQLWPSGRRKPSGTKSARREVELAQHHRIGAAARQAENGAVMGAGQDRGALQNPVFVLLWRRARRDRAGHPSRALRCGSSPACVRPPKPARMRGVLPQIEQRCRRPARDRECCRADPRSP